MRIELFFRFLGALIENRNLASAEVYIMWNGSHTEYFRQIPKIHFLSLINCKVCTASGILKAFEVHK